MHAQMFFASKEEEFDGEQRPAWDTCMLHHVLATCLSLRTCFAQTYILQRVLKGVHAA